MPRAICKGHRKMRKNQEEAWVSKRGRVRRDPTQSWEKVERRAKKTSKKKLVGRTMKISDAQIWQWESVSIVLPVSF